MGSRNLVLDRQLLYLLMKGNTRNYSEMSSKVEAEGQRRSFCDVKPLIWSFKNAIISFDAYLYQLAEHRAP